MDFVPKVIPETITKASIWTARNIEIQITEKGMKKAETGAERKFKGYVRSDKKSRFSKSGTTKKVLEITMTQNGVISA